MKNSKTWIIRADNSYTFERLEAFGRKSKNWMRKQCALDSRKPSDWKYTLIECTKEEWENLLYER